MIHNLSLCCLSPSVEKNYGLKMKTMTFSSFSKLNRLDALKAISDRSINNLTTTKKILEYCVNDLKIKGYRMTSGLIPLIAYKNANFSWNDLPEKDYIFKLFSEIGDYSRSTGIRLSFHPSEYTTLTSENEESIESSISDLKMHGDIMDFIGLESSPRHPINFHIRKDGNVDVLGAIARKHIRKLPQSVSKRITLEVNDNVSGTWTIDNLKRQFFDTVGIPITFDSLHCSLLTGGLSLEENYDLARITWGNYQPLFHFSIGKNGTKSHADYSDSIPPFYGKHDVLWDVELKAKCEAIKKIVEQIERI